MIDSINSEVRSTIRLLIRIASEMWSLNWKLEVPHNLYCLLGKSFIVHCVLFAALSETLRSIWIERSMIRGIIIVTYHLSSPSFETHSRELLPDLCISYRNTCRWKHIICMELLFKAYSQRVLVYSTCHKQRNWIPPHHWACTLFFVFYHIPVDPFHCRNV